MNKVKATYQTIIGALILVPVFCSCTLAYTYRADILQPANYIFTPDVENVGVISRLDLESRPTGLSGAIKLKEFELDSALLKSGVLGLEDGLIESPLFNVVKAQPARDPFGFNDNLELALNWRIVEKICPDSTDVLIELVSANFVDDVFGFFEEDGFLDNYYCIATTIFWRLYNINTRNIQLFVLTDTVKIEYREHGDQRKAGSNKALLMDLNYGCTMAGNRFASNLAPSWHEIERVYFKSLIPKFREAEKFVKIGDWNTAAEIWRPFTLSRNKALASCACYNMAVASEMSDQFENSLEWLKKAEGLGVNIFIEEYRTELHKRIKQKEILDLQFSRVGILN